MYLACGSWPGPCFPVLEQFPDGRRTRELPIEECLCWVQLWWNAAGPFIQDSLQPGPEDRYRSTGPAHGDPSQPQEHTHWLPHDTLSSRQTLPLIHGVIKLFHVHLPVPSASWSTTDEL